MLAQIVFLSYINYMGSATRSGNQGNKMTSITVTSKTGKQINLSVNADYCGITATVGAIKFGAEQTETGFKTRFPETINGTRTHIHVVCEGEELVKVQALYVELHDAINRRHASQAEYERHHAGVLKMMAE